MQPPLHLRMFVCSCMHVYMRREVIIHALCLSAIWELKKKIVLKKKKKRMTNIEQRNPSACRSVAMVTHFVDM